MRGIRLLGPVSIVADKPEPVSGRLPRSLLATLAMSCGQQLSMVSIVDDLWGPEHDGKAHRSVHTYISQLRRDLKGVAAIERAGDGYVLVPVDNELAVDALQFQALVAEGIELCSAAPTAAERCLRDARALWTGPAFQGALITTRLADHVQSLETSRFLLSEALAELEFRRGSVTEALREARGCLQIDQGSIGSWRIAIESLRLLGRDSAATELLSGARTELVERRGLAGLPPELARLEADVEADASFLSPAMEADASWPFVGRGRELQALRQRWERARASSAQVVLVSGEAGIGKTSLLSRFLAGLKGHGILLYGRAIEDSPSPLRAVSEAFSGYLTSRSEVLLREIAQELDGRLARLVPVLQLSDVGPSGAETDRSTDRYRMYEAVQDLINVIARKLPVALVIDDIHWLSEVGFGLLDHLIRSPSLKRCLIICSYRVEEVDPASALGRFLAELYRETNVELLALDGLGRDELEELLQRQGVRISGGLVARLLEASDGNPFFLAEMLRLARASGRPQEHLSTAVSSSAPAVSDGMRNLLKRSLARIDPELIGVLQTAALIGPEFDVATLAAAIGEENLVYRSLEAAEEAELIKPVGLGLRYSFTHAYVQRAVAAELSGFARKRLHHRIAEVLTERGRDGITSVEIARHLVEGLPISDPRATALACVAAGEELAESMSFEDAIRQWRIVERIDDELQILSATERCDLALQIGEVLRRAGDPGHRGELFAAAAQAERLGLKDRRGRAALSLADLGSSNELGLRDDLVIELLRSCLGSVPPAAHGSGALLRAELLAALADKLETTDEVELRGPLFREALGLASTAFEAGRPGAVDALQAVLWRAYFAMDDPHAVDERKSLGRRLVELGEKVRNRRSALEGHRLLFSTSIIQCDFEGAIRAQQRTRSLADALREPGCAWSSSYQQFILDQLAGRLDAAEAEAAQSFEIGRLSAFPDSRTLGVLGGQIFSLRFCQGRLTETVPAALEFVASMPGIPGWKAAAGVALVDAGRLEEARSLLDELIVNGQLTTPRDFTYTTVLVFASSIAQALGDPVAAQILLDAAEPLREQWAWCGAMTMGPVALGMAQCAATLGRIDAALDLCELAQERSERIESPLWVAHCELEAATLLAESGRSAQATLLAGKALQFATAAGLDRLGQLSSDLLGRV